MPRKLTTNEFIEKAKKVFPEYDYSNVNYKGAYNPVEIICPNCGKQYIKPTYLLSGRGCKCFKNRYTANNSKPPKIDEVNKMHPTFEIDWNTYKSCMENLNVKCKVCNNIFTRSYNSLLSKKTDCPYCCGRYKKLEDVLAALKEKYGDKIFDFSLITCYNNSREKKQIICKKCNSCFQSDLHDLLSAKGRKCPYCFDESRGEKEIRVFLEANGYAKNIDFFKEKRFEQCKDKNTLPFDFYLPKLNLLIEYQGEQHYSSRFGGKTDLEATKKHDKIKKEFAIKNNIKLLEIPYWEFKNIKEILHENLEKKC